MSIVREEEKKLDMSQNANDRIFGHIIQSNHHIRHRVQRSVKDFLRMREDLLKQLKSKKLNDISKEFEPLIDAMNIERLNQQVTSSKVQLALCGENSSGKTSFIHLLLGIGNILPADVGPITARIVRMRYADAEDACVVVYPSLKDSLEKKNGTTTNLSSFFNVKNKNNETDWKGISNALVEHVRRPIGMNIKSEEFVIWAKHFIEIRIPSAILKLGIDVYDTAGFRIRDAQVLKDCLYDLVRLVHPTIVFLYDNPSGSDETNDCFLALKETLKHCDSTNIFFLNTKADIDQMANIEDIEDEEDFLELLNNERIRRYNLLLKTPGMVNAMIGGLPKTLDKCNCFDICSVNSEWMPPFGPMMNTFTLERLIQFVANSDLILSQRVSNLVLPSIEVFFNLLLITSHRTKDQLEKLRLDCQDWIETYFKEHRHAFQKFLHNVFIKILNQLRNVKRDLIRRASQQHDLTSITLFLQFAIEQEVMKGIVYDALGTVSKTALDLIESNQNLMINAIANEILISTIRNDTNDPTENNNNNNEEIKNGEVLKYFMMQTITAPALMVTDQLFNDDMNNIRNNLLPSIDDQHSNNNNNSYQLRTFDSTQIANQYLNEIENQINTSEKMFDTTVSTWCTQKKNKLLKQINQQCDLAISLLKVTHQAHEVLQKFIKPFVHIECQLQAAQNLAKFNGKEPIILTNNQTYLSSSTTTIYRIDEIEWGSIKKNLFVKRLTCPIVDQPDISYLEAHYHRKMNHINIPNIVKLSYLYENRLSENSYEVWMIFENESLNINRNLHNFVKEYSLKEKLISFKKICQILFPIINALASLHENELVHRNVKSTNILLDENDQSFLADLGDWYLSNNDQLNNIQYHHHQLSDKSHEINDDIIGFGKLGFTLLTILDREQMNCQLFVEFKQLMGSCLEPKDKTAKIRHHFEHFIEKLNRS